MLLVNHGYALLVNLPDGSSIPYAWVPRREMLTEDLIKAARDDVRTVWGDDPLQYQWQFLPVSDMRQRDPNVVEPPRLNDSGS